MALYDSILDTVGNTPIIKLNRLSPSHATVHVKVESFNPGGSVKDRLGLGKLMIQLPDGLGLKQKIVVDEFHGLLRAFSNVANHLRCRRHGFKRLVLIRTGRNNCVGANRRMSNSRSL